MKLFGRKAPNSVPGPADLGKTLGGSDREVTHRLTKDLARAESLSRMLAASRASAVVEVADYLAGMYIYEWERLSKFWEEREEIEGFLQRICQISPQRWHQWIEFYDRERREEDAQKPARFFGSSKTEKTNGKTLEASRELNSILRTAEAIAPHHDIYEGKAIPILTSECVLLSIAKNGVSAISETLRATGLDIAALEQAARNPKHAPLRGNTE
ncbi:MAG: hypothetical protein ACRD5M_16690 [Candidatus Acidiferrales bacterium]